MAISITPLAKSKGGGSPYVTPGQTTPAAMKYLCVVVLTQDDDSAPAFTGLTDNKGNNFGPALFTGAIGGNDQVIRVFGKANAVGGAGHTFSVQSTGGDIDCAVLPCYLSSPQDIAFDQVASGGTGYRGSPFSLGSISVAGAKTGLALGVVCAGYQGTTVTYTPTNGFTVGDSYNDPLVTWPAYEAFIGAYMGLPFTQSATTTYTGSVSVKNAENNQEVGAATASALLTFVEVVTGPQITNVDGDDVITSTQQNVIVNGSGFGSSQGASLLQIVQGSVVKDQTSIDSWGNTQIQFDVTFDT